MNLVKIIVRILFREFHNFLHILLSFISGDVNYKQRLGMLLHYFHQSGSKVLCEIHPRKVEHLQIDIIFDEILQYIKYFVLFLFCLSPIQEFVPGQVQVLQDPVFRNYFE